MARDQVAGKPAMSADKAAWVAAAWVIALVGLSIALVYFEETQITTNEAYDRVMIAITLVFILAPPILGLLHRSVNVGAFVAMFGLIGWLVSIYYGSWAYTNVGGGP
jgi:hypothetical protein